jgi:rfaE bifunctional protein nucleotidyltransferase chain/domain
MNGQGRVVSRDEAAREALALRQAGRVVVLTNGHFDLLHIGHARYLRQARDLGDVLFVGVNGDAACARLKGPGRPIVPAAERAELLTCLRSVDYAVIFEEDTADELLRAIRPRYYVKGGDYSVASLPEATVAAEVGAEVRFLPFERGHSTSALIARVLSRCHP